jgi:hypothetical protein
MAIETLERRNEGSGVRYEPADGVLVVGQCVAPVALVDVGTVVHTYFDLVTAQRPAPPTTRSHVRDRDLVALASILELPPDALDAYIETELVRFLDEASTGLPYAAPQRHRVRVALAGVAAVAALAAVAAITLPGGTPAPPAVTYTVTNVGGATISESPPIAPTADGTDVGTAVVIERGP